MHSSEWFNSIEYKLHLHLERIQKAYLELVNVQSLPDAKVRLAEMRSASSDMERQIRKILEVENIPFEQIRHVGEKLQNFDLIWMNCNQFYMRYAHCKPEAKWKNLTALYYLIRDLALAAEAAAPEKYYRGSIIRIER